MSHEKTDSTLADAIWWLHGFRAACDGRDQFSSDPTRGLGDDLRAARDWIKGLAHTRTRLIGLDDRNQAFVITEAEFEVLFDGLREGATPEDQNLGRAAALKIIEAVKAERIASRQEVQF